MPMQYEETTQLINTLKKGDLFIQERSRISSGKIFVFDRIDGDGVIAIHNDRKFSSRFSNRDQVRKVKLVK